MTAVANEQQQQQPAPTLTAEVVSVRFHNEDSGFTIANVVDSETRESHTVKGVFTSLLLPGVTYAFFGTWQDDPNYGRQLDVWQSRSSLPKNVKGIMRYLTERCSYIGEATARGIVECFEDDALEILKTDPARVAQYIAGLTLERADRVSCQLRENEEAEAQDIALADLLSPAGIGPALRRRVGLSQLGLPKEPALTPVGRIAAIKDNPYCLTAVEAIGFKKADAVAKRLGIAPEDPRRIKAGLVFTLDLLTRRDGHVRIPAPTLQAQAVEILTVHESHIATGMSVMIQEGKLVPSDASDTGDTPGQMYLPHPYADERFNATVLRSLLPVEDKFIETTVLTGDHIADLAPDQAHALGACVTSGVFVLTGAPGTGKTYTIKRIVDLFPRAGVRLCAPTGKAAKRMTEMIGGSHKATTIHRLLGPEKDAKTGAWKFNHNAYNKLVADLIIVDEFSMVDNWLCARLLEAIHPKTRLIIVGDHYQLPSVGPGNVLRDIIDSGAIPTVELTTIKRQNPGYIVQSCHSVKGGGNILAAGGNGEHDLQFIDVAGNELDVSNRVLHYVEMFRRTGWDTMRQVQVITALREKTALSCKFLNERLQQLLNGGVGSPIKDIVFRAGDKVIQTRNDYDNDIVNGDIGYVRAVYGAGADRRQLRNKVVVNFENPDRRVTLSAKANDLELAYAVTCHKYQGSEADIVIIPIHKCLGNLVVQRSWLYTAISRAKRCCVLIGDRAQIERIVGRTKSQDRWTGLVEALRDE